MPTSPNRIVPPYIAPTGTGTTTDHGSLTGLNDDDHLVYLTTGRADSWLATHLGVDIQGFDQGLQDISALSPATNDMIVWNGSAWVTIAKASIGGSDHTLLSNLDWATSGHTGTISYLAGFDGTGAVGFGGWSLNSFDANALIFDWVEA